MKAREWNRAFNGNNYDFEDLVQSGYFAMLEAVRYYKTDSGYKFLTYLSQTLKKEFAQVSGVRTSKRDVLLNSFSLDDPIGEEDGASTLHDLVPDPQSELPYEGILNVMYINYVDSVIFSALSILNSKVRDLVYAIYFDEMSLTDAAARFGYTTKQAAEAQHYTAMLKLRKSRFAPELKEMLYELPKLDYAEALRGVSLQRFKDSGGLSSTERTALKHIDVMEVRK